MEIANPRPSAGRYHGARDLRTNSRSPPLSYAYRPLHLRPILLRFPRGTRARNSFPLGDRVLGLSLRRIGVNLSPPVPRSTALENEKPRPRDVTNHAGGNAYRRLPRRCCCGSNGAIAIGDAVVKATRRDATRRDVTRRARNPAIALAIANLIFGLPTALHESLIYNPALYA